MGKNQSASNLPNIIQSSNGSINFVSGSTLLMQISSSGAITTTGVISGSNALSSSYAVNSDQLDGFDSTAFVFTSSFNTYSSSMSTRTSNLESTGSTLTTASASFAVVSSSYSTASGSLSTRVTKIEGNYATTGSNVFLGAQTVCANITSTGTIIAQTLNVQQVTSSVVYSSGSNVFGCSLTNTQQFTGSVTMTGSLGVVGVSCFSNTICAPAFIACNGTIFLQRGANTCNGLIIGEQGGTISADKAAVIRTAGGTSEHLFITPGINASTNACGYIRLGGDRYSCVGVNAAPSYTIHIQGFGDHRLYHYNCGNTTSDKAVIQTEVCGDTSGNAYFAAGKTGTVWSFGRNTTTGNFEVRSNWDLANDTQTRFQITSTGVACFRCQVCLPTSNTSLVAGTYGTISNVGGIDTNIGNNAYYDGTNWRRFAAQEAARIYINRDSFSFLRKASDGAGSTISWDNTLFLAASGVACFACQVCSFGPYLTVNSGVDSTFADAFVGVYSGNNNEQNAIQTSVSSTADNSGFLFMVSCGAGLSTRSCGYRMVRNKHIFYAHNDAIMDACLTGTSTLVRIINTSASGLSRLTLVNAERCLIITNNAGDDLLSFSYDGANRLQFNTSNQWFNIGNLGVNCDNPTYALTVNGAVFASTNMRVSTGTSAGNSSDPAITTGGCTKTGIYFAGSCVGLGSGGNGVLLNAGGTLFPAANGTQDLGTSSLRWCTVYTSDLSLNNGIGDYTIVEGENDLFLYNNKQCKVYKFVVQEVCPEIAPAKRSI